MYFAGRTKNKSTGLHKYWLDSGDACASLFVHLNGSVLLVMGKTKPSGRFEEEGERGRVVLLICPPSCRGGVLGNEGSERQAEMHCSLLLGVAALSLPGRGRERAAP